MSDFDWFSLMREITEMHVKSLKNSCMEVAGAPTPSGCLIAPVAQVAQERHTGCEGAGGIWPSPRSLPGSVSGNEGVGGCGKLPLGAEAADTDAFEHRITTSPLRNEQPSDSQIYTPLYLLASEIVDLVEFERKNR